MLIEFQVGNFRSLRDLQVLSLVAAKDISLRETHTIDSGISAAPCILRSVALYGANAGGKSNVIKALQFMRSVVVGSAALPQPGQTFAQQPFRLDAKSNQQPTAFEATFVIEGVRHQYGFELTSERIISEYLLVYKAFKPQRWFDRSYNESTGKDDYSFGSGLKGQKNVWEEATRANALFLSMAVQLNSDSLRPIFDWFANRLIILNEFAHPNPEYAVGMLRQPEEKKRIVGFLQAADISIADIEVETRITPAHEVKIDFTSGSTETRSTNQEVNHLRFHHVTEQGQAVFSLDDESLGTQRFLWLTGPVQEALSKGLTLVVDELDSSMHPLLVRHLVELFHTPKINNRGAQLIFTTHDTSLLNPQLFRRDQIWFVEKDANQVSTLSPLSDFSPRKHEALERGYLTGRYGAIPVLSAWHT